MTGYQVNLYLNVKHFDTPTFFECNQTLEIIGIIVYICDNGRMARKYRPNCVIAQDSNVSKRSREYTFLRPSSRRRQSCMKVVSLIRNRMTLRQLVSFRIHLLKRKRVLLFRYNFVSFFI